MFKAQTATTDTAAPVLTVPGTPLVIETETNPDLMEGVSAVEYSDGDITAATQVISSVDTSTPGQYTVVYTVSDANGTQAIASRVVVVEASDSGPGTVPGTDPSDGTGSSGSSNGFFGGAFASIGTALRSLWDNTLGGAFGSSS